MSKERGSVTVIVLGAMIAILGMGAIVVDGGMLYYERAKHQTAVDGAALAGARALVRDGSARAIEDAQEIALANGLALSEVSVTVNAASSEVVVTSDKEVTLGLARILNFSTANVGAQAVAGGRSVSAMRNVAPLGIIWQNFVFNQVYDLKVGAGGGDSGWYGALSLGGGGASTYQENVTNGWTGWLRVGTQVPTESGNMVSPTKKGVLDRIGLCNHTPKCTYDNFKPKCPKLMIIPVISGAPIGGQVTILGFAGFFVDEFVGHGGGDNFIRGRFVEFVAEGEMGPAGQYGAVTIKLIN